MESKQMKVLLVLTLAMVAAPAIAWSQARLPYDHVHLNVPDPTTAASWYERMFGGIRLQEGPDRLRYGSTRLVFIKRADALPSAGSAIDHIGFSVRDIDATFQGFQSRGVKVVTPVRDVEGIFKLGYIEDPWGTRIEVVQDPDLLGFHHVHLRGADPAALLRWNVEMFGGERLQFKGKIDAVRYTAPGYSTVWVFAQQGDALPSEGHAIDHAGWRSTVPLAGEMKTFESKGAVVSAGARTQNMPDGSAVNFAYLAGLGGVRIEIIERPGVKPGE